MLENLPGMPKGLYACAQRGTDREWANKNTERQRQTQQESRRESKSAITLTTHGAHTLGQEGIWSTAAYDTSNIHLDPWLEAEMET